MRFPEGDLWEEAAENDEHQSLIESTTWIRVPTTPDSAMMHDLLVGGAINKQVMA